MKSWSWWVLVGGMAELFSNVLWFHSPLPAAFLIYAGNALEAVVGAWLVNWALSRPARLETLREVLLFVVLGAVVAPVVSATVGSATLAWFGIFSQTFVGAWPLWWIGDATGVLIVAPLALVVIQNWHWKAEFSRARWLEACVLGLILLGVAALSLSGYLPFAYIIMPPLLWAAVRFEFKGAAVTLALLALIAAIFTISGASQFAGDAETQRHKQIMLQLFLAISAFSALIVAAISRQHQLALLTLHQSERSLRELVETLPARIWCTTPNGEPFYFSKQLREFYGFNTDAKDEPDSPRLAAILAATIHPDDLEVVGTRFTQSLATGEPYMVRHRQRRFDGIYRWVQTHATAMRGADGAIARWNGVNFDIDDLVRTQDELRDRERELLQLVDLVPSHVWRLAPNGEPTFFNKRMVDFLGLDVADTDRPGTSRLDTVIETLHPDDALEFARRLRHCLATGERFEMRHRLRRTDGIYRWMSSRAEPIQDKEGRIVQWYGLSHDIDDQMHAEEALRRSEQQLQQLTDAVPALIWAATPEGTPSYVNKRFRDVTGATLDDLTAPDASPSLSVIHPEDVEAARQAIKHSFGTGAPYVQRYRQLRADGSYRWTETRAEPLQDDAGAILQWYGVSVDIHDLVIAQEALQQSERRYRDLFHYMPIGLAQVGAAKLIPLFKELRAEGVTDLTTYIDEHPEFLARALEALELEEANRHITEMFGAGSQEEMRGPITRYWQPGLATIRRSIEARYRGEEVFQEETKVARMDGSVIDVVFATARPGAIADKSLVGFIDITERNRAEEALRNHEREFSQLVNMVPSLLWRLSPSGEPTFFNKRLTDFFGVDGAEVDKLDTSRMAAIIKTSVHPDDAAAMAEALNSSLITGERFSMRYRLRRADGVYRWVDGSAEPLRDESGQIVQWYGLSHDIDDQLQAEEGLRNSNRQLEQMIDALPINILSFAPSRRMTYASRRYLDNVGSPTPDIENFDSLARDLAHPEDFPTMFQRAMNGFATGQPFVNRFRRRTKKGTYRWIEARAQPLLDADGAIVQWYIISIDIEDEMRAQEALRERERFLWQLVETLPAMIDCAAPNGEPVYRSQQLREFLGYQLEELDGAEKSRLNGTLDAGVHPEDLAGVKEQYARSLSSGEPYARRHRLRRFDGEYRWVETRAAPMRNDENAIVQWNVICLDIDGEVRMQEELRLAQERLARASEAASLAELSASIAHEVNQPLAAIVANSHACYRWLSAEPANVERAKITTERVIRDANSAAEVVSRVRALFKQSVENRANLALSGVIAEACSLVAGEALRRGVRIDVDVQSRLPPVAIDRTQIQQVLINLIRNGMEAMDSTAGDKALEVRAYCAGSEVRTEISDYGEGIELPDRIFEPFFTTKENGMGMGLAICRSIVEAHGGRLWAEKNEPRGARFVFTLPVVTKAAP
jgi:PAS domain S-box-containing protein